MINTAILVALITGGCAVISNVIIAAVQNGKTLYRIEQLEKKVEIHNHYVERTYNLEKQTAVLDQEQKATNKRLANLEGK